MKTKTMQGYIRQAFPILLTGLLTQPAMAITWTGGTENLWSGDWASLDPNAVLDDGTTLVGMGGTMGLINKNINWGLYPNFAPKTTLGLYNNSVARFNQSSDLAAHGKPADAKTTIWMIGNDNTEPAVAIMVGDGATSAGKLNHAELLGHNLSVLSSDIGIRINNSTVSLTNSHVNALGIALSVNDYKQKGRSHITLDNVALKYDPKAFADATQSSDPALIDPNLTMQGGISIDGNEATDDNLKTTLVANNLDVVAKTFALDVNGATLAQINQANLTTTSDGSITVQSSEIGTRVSLTDVVVTSHNVGAQTSKGAHLIWDGGRIDTVGDDERRGGIGVYVDGRGSRADLTNLVINTRKSDEWSDGVRVRFGDAELDNVDITVQGTDIRGSSALYATVGGQINGHQVRLNSSGTNTHAVSAGDCVNDRCATVTLDQNSQIITQGDRSAGIALSNGGGAALADSSVITHGADAPAIYSSSSASNHNNKMALNHANIQSIRSVAIRSSNNGRLDMSVGNNSLLKGEAGLFSVHNGLDHQPKTTLNLTVDQSQLFGRAITGSQAEAHVVLTKQSIWDTPANSNLTSLSLDNSQVRFTQPTADKPRTLTVAGELKGGSGSIIQLWTELGDDNAQSDKIVLDGDKAIASGTTGLRIKQQGGSGAQTNVGIKVVETLNGGKTGSDSFKLDPSSDGYRQNNNTIVSGAYDYALVRGGSNGEAQDWYLSSQRQPVKPTDPTEPTKPIDPPPSMLRPDTGTYFENKHTAMSMQHHTWQDRRSQMSALDDHAGWLRVEASKSAQTDSHDLKRRSTSYAIHFGSDVQQQSFDNGSRLDFGAMALLSKSNNTVSNDLNAKGAVNGYNVGAYATWQAHPDAQTGTYVDSWLMHGWYRNSVQGQGLAKEKYNARVTSASLEMGHRFELLNDDTQHIYLQPQAQAIWSKYQANDFQEKTKTTISNLDESQITLRLGAQLLMDKQTASGKIYRPSVALNYWHQPSDQSITFGKDNMTDDLPKHIYELAVGIEGQLSKDWAVAGKLKFQKGANDYQRNAGELNVTYAW